MQRKEIHNHFLSWDDLEKIWSRAKVEGTYDPSIYRKDDYGNWICRDEFCNRTSNLGWVIGSVTSHNATAGVDAADPSSLLRPIQWERYENILKESLAK